MLVVGELQIGHLPDANEDGTALTTRMPSSSSRSMLRRRHTSPPRRGGMPQSAQACALYGLRVVTAPAVGPTLSGWLTDVYSWHWCILINVPAGIRSFTLVELFVVEPEALRRDRRRILRSGAPVDYIGLILVVIGFGALQIILDRYERDDGFSSSFITGLGLTAGLGLLTLILWEMWHPQPAMNVRLMRSRAFAVSCLVMFGFGFMIVSTTQLLPQLSQTLLGYNALVAGMTLGAGGVVTLLLMPLSGFVTSRFIQPRWLIAIALGGTGLSLMSSARLDLDIDFWSMSMIRITQVMWLPFLFIPVSAVSYVGVLGHQTNDASALINLMRNLGGSVGVSFTTTMLQERTQFHHERLAEHITAYNGYGWPAPLGTIDAAIQGQAGIMSYLDIFWTLGLVALFLAPFALLLPAMPRGAVSSH